MLSGHFMNAKHEHIMFLPFLGLEKKLATSAQIIVRVFEKLLATAVHELHALIERRTC